MYCAFLSNKYVYACINAHTMLCFKQCIVGVSETCSLILNVYLFVFVLFMDKHV